MNVHSLARRWILVAMLLVPSIGLAQSGGDHHYDLEYPGWNGLTDFRAMASSADIQLTPTETLDYGELTAADRMIVIYPQTDVDVGSMADFVVDGGRLLWIDDFGRSDRMLERLDIERTILAPDDLPHERFAGGRRGLPILEPEGIHPLLEGVSTVVANRPAVLDHQGGPVVPYQERGGVVYDMNLGRGKIIVIGDASLLINQMLRIADNRTLVRNALQYLCEGSAGSCAPRLVIGSFEQTGRYGRDDPSSDSWEDLQETINDTLERLQTQIPSSPLLYYLAILLTIGLGVYLATVFSVQSPRPYSDYIGEALEDTPSPQSEFEWNLSRFDADQRDTNFALPLAILKEHVEELVLRDLDMWHPDSDERPSVVQIANRFADRYLEDYEPERRRELERSFKKLLSDLARIPTRHRVFLDSDAYFSDRDLIELYRRAMRVLEFMDLEEEYERRTEPFV